MRPTMGLITIYLVNWAIFYVMQLDHQKSLFSEFNP